MLWKTRWPAIVMAACAIGLAACADSRPAAPTETPRAALALTAVDGSRHAPIERAASRPVLVIFLLTDCPIANAYAPEIGAIQREFADVVDLYLAYVERDLTAEAGRAHQREYALPGTALLDPEKRLAKALGATITPEAVILRDGEIPYRGRIDNWYAALGKRRRKATVHDLRDALTALRDGRAVEVRRTKAVGCFIPDAD